MSFLYACLVIIGISLLYMFAIILTAHGIWLPLVVVIGGSAFAFAKLGCATHD